jgi:hypothetical protein
VLRTPEAPPEAALMELEVEDESPSVLSLSV